MRASKAIKVVGSTMKILLMSHRPSDAAASDAAVIILLDVPMECPHCKTMTCLLVNKGGKTHCSACEAY